MHLRGWLVAASLIVGCTPIHAQTAADSGMTWEAQGNWHLNHERQSIQRGDAVPPGALLTADVIVKASIVILLPDGQRLLFDCHDAHTCSQGFRVPALMAKPDTDDLDLFNAVRRAINQPHSSVETAPEPLASTTTEAEAVARLENDENILLKQSLAGLPPGQYTLTVQSNDQAQPSKRQLTWSGSLDTGRLTLPGPGLYRLRLFGSLGGERMRVVLLAVPSTSFPTTLKAFTDARKTLAEWNETFPGWPVHEWLQLYLKILSGAHPDDNSSQ